MAVGVSTDAAGSWGGSVDLFVYFFAVETQIGVHSSAGLAGRVTRLAKSCTCVEIESWLAGGAGWKRGYTVLAVRVDADTASS